MKWQEEKITINPILATIVDINFCPEHRKDGRIEMTFAAPSDTRVVAGDYVILTIDKYKQIMGNRDV